MFRRTIHRISPSMAVSLLALLVALGGTALATTKTFTLGTTNTVDAASTVNNGANTITTPLLTFTNTTTGTGATAMALNVASGHAPFTTNSTGRVINLNADRLDNFDSSAFLRRGVLQTNNVTVAGGVVDVNNTGTTNGVQGKTASSAASGVYGENTTGSGYGIAGRVNGVGSAVFGDNPGGGYAGNFQGDVHVTRNLVCGGCVSAGNITGKVDDADKLDGRDSSAFIQGAGQAGGQAVAIPAGQNLWLGNPLLGFLRLIYACPANLASNGTFAFNNDSGSVANVFVESGGANPSYYQMNPGDQVQFPASTTGDSWHIQAQGALGIITIEAASVHRPGSNDCHVQAQALLTK